MKTKNSFIDKAVKKALKERIAARVAAFASIAEGLKLRRRRMRQLNADRKAGRSVRGFLNERNQIFPFPY